MEIEARPGLLVQRFSWELEAREQDNDAEDDDGITQLRADFVQSWKTRSRAIVTEKDRIEEYFSRTRPGDEARFEQTRQDLMNAMKEFQDLVPEELRSTEMPKSWSDVELAVSTVQAEWEIKTKESYGARARHWVRKMCTGLHNHSAVLNMLPTNNEYVSLISGAVVMIIKASANYSDITESFAQGVSEINDAVAIVQKSQIYDSQPIQQLVMRLYTRVFSYLRKFMLWYTSRSRSRFLKSFNENVQKTFDEDLQQVRDISMQLSQQIQLHMAADVRTSKLMVEDTNWAVKYLVQLAESDEKQRRIQQEVNEELLQRMFLIQFNKSLEEMRESSRQMMLEYNERIRQCISGTAMTELLIGQASRNLEILDDAAVAGIPRTSPSPTPYRQSQSSGMSVANNTSFTSIQHQAAEIKYRSRCLDEYCNWEHVSPFSESPIQEQQLSAHPAFSARLGSFTRALKPQILYAFGRYQPERPNLLRSSAAQYASLARQHGIPTVSYFCRLSAEPPPPRSNRTRESVELCALLYTVIRQVIDLLPVEFAVPAGDMDLGEERFARLDGTLRTWGQAIRLLSNLVACLQVPQLLFVLDGINLLEDDFDVATTARVYELVRALTGLVDDDSPGVVHHEIIVKVLFTTAGSSTVLCRELHSSRVIACGGPNSPREPGKSGASRQLLF
ncbi:hypothetical protein P885DRAFT_79864 [Corynascus similis CBS 632.67]